MPSSEAVRAPRRWIVSRRFDLALVALPYAAAIATLPLLVAGAKDVPLWAFLLLIVAFDVAHVWSTLYISYLDREAMRRRRRLFAFVPAIAILLAFRIHLHSPTLFWTILAYVAIYHFISQQWGFVALYKAVARERDRFDYYLDKWTLWVGALGPVLLWHASPARQFDWFNAGESFLARIDPALKPDIVVVMGVFALTYVARQVYCWRTTRALNVGKNLWMVAAWVSWSVGIGYADHPLVSAAFINLLHGIPFLALVWHRCNHRWSRESHPASRLVAWLSDRRRLAWFYLLVLVPALIEETLWDGIVWRVYLPTLLDVDLPILETVGMSAAVALLSLPQIVHYILDGWLWKLDGSNPDLREALGL